MVVEGCKFYLPEKFLVSVETIIPSHGDLKSDQSLSALATSASTTAARLRTAATCQAPIVPSETVRVICSKARWRVSGCAVAAGPWADGETVAFFPEQQAHT